MKMNIIKMPVVMALCCMALFSCNNVENGGDANDETKVESADEEASVQAVKYEVGFSQDLYDFFDMELVYTNAAGKNVTMKVTTDLNLTVTPEVKLDSAVMRVTAKPKENMPQIDENKLYRNDVKCCMTVDTDKQKGNSYNSNSTMAIKGDKWKTFVSEEKTMVSKVAEL